MRAHIVCLALLFSGVVSSSPGPDDAGAGRRVEQILSEIKTLKSEFEQTLSGAHGEVLERAGGTLYLQKPDRFRWDYVSGVKQLIVSDGSRVWLYDEELDQVTVRALGKSLSATPAMLLSGSSRASEQFKISDLGHFEGLDWIRLLPKTQDTDFREIRLGLSGNDLARMTLKDKLGQTTDLRFTGLERNPTLEASLFLFTPPPGVDVIGKAGR